jgi:hypothetical protein
MQQVDHPVGSARPNRPVPPNSAGGNSRRTVRLPDLTAAPPTPAASTAMVAPGATKPAAWATPVPPPAAAQAGLPSANEAEQSAKPSSKSSTLRSAFDRPAILHRLQEFRQSALQPKLWLALGTAIAVQLVLSWIFSPKTPEAPPADRPAAQNRRIAADAPAAEPAARIVAPPAVSPSASAGAPDANDAVAVPLGHLNDGAEPWQGDSGTASAEATHDAAGQPIRMAENVRSGRDATQFDGQIRGDTAGATLDALVPLETAEGDAAGGNP